MSAFPQQYHSISVATGPGLPTPKRADWSTVVSAATVLCLGSAALVLALGSPSAAPELWASAPAQTRAVRGAPIARLPASPYFPASVAGPVYSLEQQARPLARHPSVVASTATADEASEPAAPATPKPKSMNPFSKFLRLLSFPLVLVGGVLLALLRKIQPSRRIQYEGGVMAMAATDSAKPKRWSPGQFAEQFLFFNGKGIAKAPVNLVAKLVTPSKPEAEASPIISLDGTPIPSSDAPGAPVVLVTGATGGVGKRCVEQLLMKGRRVRALVRDLEKAQRVLAPAQKIADEKGTVLEVVVADLTQKQTLLPAMFEGVKQVMSCAAVMIAPKEGDNVNRDKYMQGIKFFDPEVVGDTPETVEYLGMQNLVASLKPKLGDGKDVPLFSIKPGTTTQIGQAWGNLDDCVMGGVSESGLKIVAGAGEDGEAAGVFYGIVRTENNGGFVSMRTQDYEPPLDLSATGGLQLRVKGDGRRYKLQVRTRGGWDVGGYSIAFDTEEGVWQTIRLPWKDFVANRRTKIVDDAPPLNSGNLISIQLTHSKFEFGTDLNPRFRKGPFELPLTSVVAYTEAPTAPTFVHVGSAGVTRWNRPGIDVEQEPPAVRMNDMLGGLLTYKLKAEDVIRESGAPYMIVRPCALTEEPGGMPLVTDQGDVIKGKVSRDDASAVMVAALDQPKYNITFEMKSTIPFSQQWEGPEEPVVRDWDEFFAPLVQGVDGKTVDGVYTGGREAIEA